MKQVNEARTLEDGAVDVKHEIETVCSVCQDPFSAEEQATKVCTACGAAWKPAQNVNVFVTSIPVFVTAFI